MHDESRFNKIEIGDNHTIIKTITDEMVQAFADLSGDYNPVHMDEYYCREHGSESRIAHGMLILSFISTLIGMHLPGEGSVWMSQQIDFIKPVKIGDTVQIKGKVVLKNNSNALFLNIITMKIVVRNQTGDMIARGTVKVSI